MIPKRIITIWLSESDELPPLIKKCAATHKLNGYEHLHITLQNCYRGSPYIQQALNSPHSDGVKYCKASDYLRMHYLLTLGGIYIDMDTEILPNKNFDSLLHNRMFAAREENGFIGAAVIGAEKGYPFIKSWMEEVEANFRGDDDKNFESSMDILVRGYFEKDWYKEGFVLVPTETFYPYSRQKEITNITENTICLHNFNNSWVSEKELIL